MVAFAAEIIDGLIGIEGQADGPVCYLNVNRSWTPTVPIKNTTVGFQMIDFLTYAGVDPATRHSQNPTHA